MSERYYFTFGCGQKHAGHYVIIEADTPAKARVEMFQRYGNKWSMMYDSAAEAGVDRFGITLLEVVQAAERTTR